jgi:hypothetical protein
MTDQDSQVSIRRGFVAADFLAHDYRISGEVNVRTRPLADTLNDPTTDYIEIENIYVSPIQNPADIKAHYQVGSLRKENISKVILSREEDGLSKTSTYGSYIGYTLRPVFLTVPGFEVRGLLEVAPKIELRAFMATYAERFIPITEATATVSLNPNIRFQGGIILVNKQRVGIFCLAEEEE